MKSSDDAVNAGLRRTALPDLTPSFKVAARYLSLFGGLGMPLSELRMVQASPGELWSIHGLMKPVSKSLEITAPSDSTAADPPSINKVTR